MAAVTQNTRPQRKQTLSQLARIEERTAIMLLLPTFILLLSIAIYPLGRVFYFSVTDKRFASSDPVNFVGFQNYAELLSMTIRRAPPKVDANNQPVLKDGKIQYEAAATVLPQKPVRYKEASKLDIFGTRFIVGARNPAFVRSIWDTTWFAAVTVTLETLLGLIIALALSRKFFGRGLMRTAMLVPWAIITAVSSLIWQWMFKSDRSGFFNMFFNSLGWTDGNTVFLVNKSLQIWSGIAIDVWKTTPFMALLLIAGLSTIPSDLYEAAEIDGASKIQQFFSMTLPLLVPTLAVALIFRTLDALRVFDLFQILFGEKRYSMSTFTQFTLVSGKDVGLSSAASVVIFIILFAFAIFYMRSLKVDADE
ncbi:MAG: carbohydrate ABC transporter permease [Trueperaceae bacterium]